MIFYNKVLVLTLDSASAVLRLETVLATADDDGLALGWTGCSQCRNGKALTPPLLIAAPGGAFGKSMTNSFLLWSTCPANGHDAQRSDICGPIEYGTHPEAAWMRKCHPMQVPHLKFVGEGSISSLGLAYWSTEN